MNKPCRIQKGWDQAGRKGKLLAIVTTKGRNWAVVAWEDEDEPELFKAEGLEVEDVKYVPLKIVEKL